MVIELQPASQPAAIASGVRDQVVAAGDEAATRLAIAIAAAAPSASGVSAGGASASIDTIAARIGPIVSWAREVPRLRDAEAVRRGVTVARTRTLVGMPIGGTLVALHELTSVLEWDSARASRLDALAIEVGRRVERTGRGPNQSRPTAG
jgi:hypothetical protein